MILAANNGFLELEHLSNIELYYSEPEDFTGKDINIAGDEFRHMTKIMRHKTGDNIYVTNGLGKIFLAEISSISKAEIKAVTKKNYTYENKYKNIFFCIPKLKSPDRFEFALEKSVELGITNFIVYNSKRAIAKGSKIERWNKILLSAMKQSLRSHLPRINEIKDLEEIIKIGGEIIIFEQDSEKNIKELKIKPDKKYVFVFGPEGGLDQEELNFVNKEQIYNLADNRLRSETATIKFASILSTLLYT